MSNEQAKQFLDQATQSLQSGQFAHALELVDQSIAIDASNAEAFIVRGIALSQTNQPDQATEAFQKAIMISPNSSKAYYNLAVHLYAQGKKVQAADIGREALRVDPQHGGARDLVTRIDNELNPEMNKPTGPQVTDSVVREPERPAQQGFQQPPAAGYYRPGYEPGSQPVHSIGFIENLGKTWDVIGWVISALGVVTFVISLSVIPQMMEAMQKAMSDPNAAQQMQGMTGPLGYFAYIPLLGSMVWVIMDIADRRSNWLWLLPQVLCGCCCGVYWLVQAVYMLAGRKK